MILMSIYLMSLLFVLTR